MRFMTLWNDKIHGLETEKSLVDNDVSFDGLKKKIYDERVIVSECRQSLMLRVSTKSHARYGMGLCFFMFKCFVLATFTHFYDIISVSKTWW